MLHNYNNQKMTRITSLFIGFAAVILLASCGGSSDYKKTKSGLLYRITSTGNNPQVKVGEFIKFDYVQKVNDSVLGSSYGKLPAYTRIDSIGDVYDVSEAFRFLHKGDSLETVLIADSIINKNPGQQMAPFIKKGAKLYVFIKVKEVFATEADLQADCEGSDHCSLRIPPPHWPLLRVPRQRPELRRQLPQHDVQDDRAKVQAEPRA